MPQLHRAASLALIRQLLHRRAAKTHDRLIPMRLTLAVVLACCRADEARRRPARPMRQRDVDRWRARQRQHTYKPPAGARDAFKEQLARLRQQTIDAKHKRPPQPPHALPGIPELRSARHIHGGLGRKAITRGQDLSRGNICSRASAPHSQHREVRLYGRMLLGGHSDVAKWEF